MISKWLAVAALAGLGTVPARAEMVTAQDPGSVVRTLQQSGYPASLGTDTVGDPMITSTAAGTEFQIFFYNCTDHQACATVQFHSRYKPATPISLERINEWNTRKRFGRAFLDKTGSPVLEMDVDLDDGGLSPLLFIDNIEFWASILGDFERHIGVRPPAPLPTAPPTGGR